MKIFKVRDVTLTISKPWKLFAAHNKEEAITEAQAEDGNPLGKYTATRYELYDRTQKVRPKLLARKTTQ